MKKCSQCGVEKPIEDFVVCTRCKSGRQAYCKRCHANKQNKRYSSTYQKTYMLKTLYGLTSEEYLELLKKQQYVCPICNKPLLNRGLVNDSNQNKNSIDHSHTQNKVRGVLHSNCNILLGMANDSIGILENAIRYLKETN